MDKKLVVSCLEKLGLGEKESEVYLELAKNPLQNGSQVAKKLNMPRPTIYDVIWKLLNKGYLIAIENDDITYYSAVTFDVLIQKLKKELEFAEKNLKKELKEVIDEKERKVFITLKSKDKIMRNFFEILTSSTDHVYINTNFNLDSFKGLFLDLRKRGVKIVIYTVEIEKYLNLDVDVQYREGMDEVKRGDKILVVSDMKKALSATNISGTYTGTYSEELYFIKTCYETIYI